MKLDPAAKITWAAQGCVQLGFKHLREWKLLVPPAHLFQFVTTLMMKKKSQDLTGISLVAACVYCLFPVHLQKFGSVLFRSTCYITHMNKILRSHFTLSSRVWTNLALSVSHLMLQIPPSQQTGPFKAKTQINLQQICFGFQSSEGQTHGVSCFHV